MSESRGVVSLEIAKLLQKSRDLHNNPKDVLVGRMIVHTEPLHSLVILNDRIKSLLLQFLPVTTQLILVMRIKQKQKVFNIGHHLLQSKVTLCTEQVKSLLLQLTNRIVSRLKSTSNPLMPTHHRLTEIVTLLQLLTLKHTLHQPSRVYQKHTLVLHYYTPKHTQKLNPLLIVELSEDKHFTRSQSLLSQSQKDQSQLEFSPQNLILSTVVNNKVKQLTYITHLLQPTNIDLLLQILNPIRRTLRRQEHSRIKLQKRVSITGLSHTRMQSIKNKMVPLSHS